MNASVTGEVDDAGWVSCMFWTEVFELRPKKPRCGFSTPGTHDSRTLVFRRRKTHHATRATRIRKPGGKLAVFCECVAHGCLPTTGPTILPISNARPLFGGLAFNSPPGGPLPPATL